MLGKRIVLVGLFSDSSAEGIVGVFATGIAIHRTNEPVFGVISVIPGIKLRHVAVIVVQRTDAAFPGNIDFGVLVQAVRVVGLRCCVFAGTGAVSDVVERIAHGFQRYVAACFPDGAGEFGPLIVGVVPGCVVLERGRCPAAEGNVVLFVDGRVQKRALERVRESHWRGNQKFSPCALFGLCVPCRHFEFNASVKFCFRLYYTALDGKMQEGNGEKS